MIWDEDSLMQEGMSVEMRRPRVAERRKYGVLNVEGARAIARMWLEAVGLVEVIDFGLPEIDDRYHVWRVPLLSQVTGERLGEVVIDARSTLVVEKQTTRPEILEARLLGRSAETRRPRKRSKEHYVLSSLRNIIACGDCEEILQDLPAASVDLVFTSPPYYNARPEYTDYVNYEEYLLKMRKVIQAVHRVLNEGRFFVMNVSPILIRRTSRNASSRRIAVPFDMHRLFIEEGYDFIDDIIWVKPEGAGWATGRGRRFAADRNPLQYKPVPVTEYVLVYRKRTDKLIDWNIRAYPDQEAVEASRIDDGYERTNVWEIKPAHDPRHPAIFPLELAEKVIRYYSFKGVVLIEINPEYARIITEEAKQWLGKAAKDVLTINCPPIDVSDLLF